MSEDRNWIYLRPGPFSFRSSTLWKSSPISSALSFLPQKGFLDFDLVVNHSRLNRLALSICFDLDMESKKISLTFL